MAAQPPLIPYLENIKRWIWLGIFGGAALAMLIVFAIVGMNPEAPANQLIGWSNSWLFLLPGAMVAYGVYVSARYWRCPQCKLALPTRYAVWARCRRCGTVLRVGG